MILEECKGCQYWYSDYGCINYNACEYLIDLKGEYNAG